MVNKQKILIVDDDENIAELISLYLIRYPLGCSVCIGCPVMASITLPVNVPSGPS